MIAYELALPQRARCCADADPPHAQHEGKKFRVMRNSLKLTRSRVINSQRAIRGVTAWKRLHAAVCAIWIINKWVKRNNSRRNAALLPNSRRKSATFIRIACATALYHGAKRRGRNAQRQGNSEHAFGTNESNFCSPAGFMVVEH